MNVKGGDYVDESSDMDCRVGARFRHGCGGWLHLPLGNCSEWRPDLEHLSSRWRRSSLALNATAIRGDLPTGSSSEVRSNEFGLSGDSRLSS
jgi:hypothetical protein